MGKKLVDMIELEYCVASTVVVATVVHYTRLARVVRGMSLSISDFGNRISLSHIIAQVRMYSYLRLLFT